MEPTTMTTSQDLKEQANNRLVVFMEIEDLTGNQCATLRALTESYYQAGIQAGLEQAEGVMK